MKIRILASASQDLIDGYRFYEKQSEGLGSYFLDTLYSDIDSLVIYGGMSAPVRKGAILTGEKGCQVAFVGW